MVPQDIINSTNPRILKIFAQCNSPEQQIGVSVLVILTWIAQSDGDFDESERQFINSCGEQNGVNRFTSQIISICADKEITSLLFGLDFLDLLEST